MSGASKILVARPRNRGPGGESQTPGILEAPAAARAPQSRPQAKQPQNKIEEPRLKVVIRRLPPGLTQQELEATLGPDWTPGGGRVDYFNFKQGKMDREYVMT
jgi:regulator of nonsense transcripts 3